MKEGDEIHREWEKLRTDGFRGPDWDAFRSALMEAAFRQVLGLDLAELVKRARRLGVPYAWLAGEFPTPDEFRELAGTLLGDAMRTFEEHVRMGHGNAWRPEGGNTPLTHLVNGVALHLPNCLDAWRAERGRIRAAGLTDDIEAEAGSVPARSEFDRVDDAAHAAALLAGADPVTKAAVIDQAAGFSDAEIAERHGIPIETVRSRRRCFRDKIRGRRGME
ncbi:hypothetical protein [Phytohabitans rumicis]|uniref:Uncharacterized protein n=1 Tax=Phytohabitans rumicis TaxID=1076125 RepID=A0A6V8LDC5_9ACTN|nr:hypothetical protein [Phytohabitans rumicis]GFJ92589.1 hypothetical protein Prum_062310 [Phytohabitans rumicis]